MEALKSAHLWVACFLVCGWNASARAEPCGDQPECQHGFVCVQYTATPDCAGEANCGEPTETYACRLANCASNADCAERMRCIEETVTTCPTAEMRYCPPNEPCETREDSPAPRSCKETQVKHCVPRHELPCSVDNDCGENFSCTTTKQCKAKEISCEADGTCPVDFACNTPSEPNAAKRCEPRDYGYASTTDGSSDSTQVYSGDATSGTAENSCSVLAPGAKRSNLSSALLCVGIIASGLTRSRRAQRKSH